MDIRSETYRGTFGIIGDKGFYFVNASLQSLSPATETTIAPQQATVALCLRSGHIFLMLRTSKLEI